MPINETHALVPSYRFHSCFSRRGLGVVEPTLQQRYGSVRPS